jgi:hypothetical protein
VILWQRTDLSIIDVDGNYVDDVPVGVTTDVGFDLSIASPGATPEVVVITTVVPTLWRYRKAHELTGPTVERRVLSHDETDIPEVISSPNVAITLPSDLEADQMYQLKLVITDGGGLSWVRTREYRVATA